MCWCLSIIEISYLLHKKFLVTENFKVGLKPPELEVLLFTELCA